jgi:hypothetical protein
MRPSKSEVEMTYCNAMLELLGIDSVLEARNPPAPDLVFGHEGRTIGIEHTRLFTDEGSCPKSYQAYESILEDIAERCRAEYTKRGLPPVEVTLHMSHEHASRTRVPVLVDWIVNAVAENLPPSYGSVEIPNEATEGMPHEINTIRMIRVAALTKAYFHSARAAWIMTVETSWLQSKVDEKADRIAGYLSACDEVWLLMVEEQTGLANTMEIPRAIWAQPLEHQGFARIYVLRGRAELHRMPIPV